MSKFDFEVKEALDGVLDTSKFRGVTYEGLAEFYNAMFTEPPRYEFPQPEKPVLVQWTQMIVSVWWENFRRDKTWAL